MSTSTLPDFEVTFTSETVPVSAPLVRKPTSPGAVFDVTVRVSSTVPSTFVTIGRAVDGDGVLVRGREVEAGGERRRESTE